jgi:hypothetical protein
LRFRLEVLRRSHGHPRSRAVRGTRKVIEMKTILAIAAASSAMLAISSAAQAQDCLNGFRELGNQVIVQCDEGFAPGTDDTGLAPATTEEGLEPETAAAPVEPLSDEPLTTGSVPTGVSPPPPQVAAPPPPAIAETNVVSLQAEGPWACQPGQYWLLESEGSERMMMC